LDHGRKIGLPARDFIRRFRMWCREHPGGSLAAGVSSAAAGAGLVIISPIVVSLGTWVVGAGTVLLAIGFAVAGSGTVICLLNRTPRSMHGALASGSALAAAGLAVMLCGAVVKVVGAMLAVIGAGAIAAGSVLAMASAVQIVRDSRRIGSGDRARPEISK